MEKLNLREMILILKKYKQTKIEDIEYIKNYIIEINKYSKYLIPEKQELWKNETTQLIYDLFRNCKITDSIDMNKYDELYSYIEAGEILETYYTTKSWEQISNLIEKQDHYYYSLYTVSKILLTYSYIGPEFIDKYFKFILKREENYKTEYDKAKEYNNSRNNLNKKLIKTLCKRK